MIRLSIMQAICNDFFLFCISYFREGQRHDHNSARSGYRPDVPWICNVDDSSLLCTEKVT